MATRCVKAISNCVLSLTELCEMFSFHLFWYVVFSVFGNRSEKSSNPY